MNLKCTLLSERSQPKKGEYNSNHMLIHKRQDYRGNNKISVCQWCMWREEGRHEQAEHKKF